MGDVSSKAGLFSGAPSECPASRWVEGGLGEGEKPNQSRVTSVLFRFICRDELLSQGTEWNSGARVSPCPRRMGPPVLSESCAASPSWITEGWRGPPADRRARCSQDCQAELCRERVCHGGGQVAAWTACFSRLGAETSVGPPCPAQAFPMGTCFQGRHV